MDSDSTPTEVKLDEATVQVSGTNHLAAMKAVMEQHVADHIVKPGFAKEGEIICVADEEKNSIVLKTTGERPIDDILKLAFPEQWAEAHEGIPKRKPKFKIPAGTEINGQTPNRAGRRRLRLI